MIKKVKLQYQRREFEKANKNPKETWKLIKTVGNLHKSQSSSSKLFSSSSDLLSTVNDVNHFFANIGKELAFNITNNLAAQLPSDPVISPPIQLISSGSRPNSMALLKTDFVEVEQIINNLKTTSATGWDSIPASLIKSAKHVLVPVLTHLFNLCPIVGVFPGEFKKALVHPIYKSGDTGSVTNYRPISVLSILSKILEKLLYRRLTGYLDSFNIIADNQYGFRRGKSTEDAILNMTELVAQNFNSKYKTIGLFLDLSKAFDTVSIPSLMEKMLEIGVRGIAYDIFKSYLTDCTQRVIINDTVSQDEALCYGVPQGSVLGPTLFSIYVNDLCKLSLPNCKILSYADGTVLLIHGADWEKSVLMQS